MIVIATFANRTYDAEAVELVCAWDEYAIEGNYDGWRSERQAALDSWGADLLRVVDVQLDVPMTKIAEVLNPNVTVTAAVVSIDGITTAARESR